MSNENEPHAPSGILVDKLTERLIRLTNCISRIQTAFIEQQKDYSLLSASLEDLLAISASDFGFIGEVWTCPVTSQPVLRFLATKPEGAPTRDAQEAAAKTLRKAERNIENS